MALLARITRQPGLPDAFDITLGNTRLVRVHAVDEHPDGRIAEGQQAGSEIVAQPYDTVDTVGLQCPFGLLNARVIYRQEIL